MTPADRPRRPPRDGQDGRQHGRNPDRGTAGDPYAAERDPYSVERYADHGDEHYGNAGQPRPEDPPFPDADERLDRYRPNVARPSGDSSTSWDDPDPRRPPRPANEFDHHDHHDPRGYERSYGGYGRQDAGGPPVDYPRGSYPPGTYPPGTYPPGGYPPGGYPPEAYPPDDQPREGSRREDYQSGGYQSGDHRHEDRPYEDRPDDGRESGRYPRGDERGRGDRHGYDGHDAARGDRGHAPPGYEQPPRQPGPGYGPPGADTPAGYERWYDGERGGSDRGGRSYDVDRYGGPLAEEHRHDAAADDRGSRRPWADDGYDQDDGYGRDRGHGREPGYGQQPGYGADYGHGHGDRGEGRGRRSPDGRAGSWQADGAPPTARVPSGSAYPGGPPVPPTPPPAAPPPSPAAGRRPSRDPHDSGAGRIDPYPGTPPKSYQVDEGAISGYPSGPHAPVERLAEEQTRRLPSAPA
ncbi:hypothetical protein AB1460_05780, partial [Parafrankia sp. FMc2]